ncbi:8026_t:CDS:2 [Funneliformis caledonium]|uniref:8026_t:CDS:1 n=1 Tax=Funneliformis caledonium TaxID=1117310 RepID=A0A9N8WED8_9GLOM|nr:8026_t:CDS:2 [Funneliformis caledonium]
MVEILENVIQISVNLNPDPVVPGQTDIFEVSGTLDSDFTDTAYIFVDYFGKNLDDPILFQLCKGCQYKAKTPFKISLKVYTPSVLSDSYGIMVYIQSENLDFLGCAMALVGDESPPKDASALPIPR